MSESASKTTSSGIKPTTEKSPPVRPKHQESTRDTIESILFAFVLAFLFRTFEAEAFVIPTGSMAPTLYGRHKETTCSSCGFHITVGASEEVDAKSGYLLPNQRLQAAVCPNCGFENKQIHDELAFNGDRILVNKYPYELGDPDRWDVFVFKFPEEPGTNYIKRLVGLPGETIRIRGGNLFTWDGERETILRKPPEKQRRLQIPVHNNAFVSSKLLEAGWPERWAAVKPSQDVHAIGGWHDDPVGWSAIDEQRRFSIKSEDAQELKWLRYRHLLPSLGDWDNILAGGGATRRARLVGDLCGYNLTLSGNNQVVDPGIYWVPDLTLSFTITINSADPEGELVLELTEGVLRYRCRIQIATGEARLEQVNDQLDGQTQELARATSGLQGVGNFRISFANVDDRICLWINNRLVDFGDGALLNISNATMPRLPTPADLCPAGIAVNHLAATVADLLIERDVYYRADMHDILFQGDLAEALYDPESWAEWYQQRGERSDFMELRIPEDHYLALGDNSPRSRDSRYWKTDLQTVPRSYLIGKAFWVYWPHGVPFLNGGKGFAIWPHYKVQGGGKPTPERDYPRYSAPFYPQVSRMKRIR